MTEEEWRPVPGYEGLYEVSDLGRVRSLKFSPPRAIGQGASSHGYLQVGLSHRGERVRMFRVHRLVLEAFRGPCPSGMEALHGNNDRADASLVNLAWGTPARNQGDRARDHTTNRGEKCANAKLTWEEVCTIREALAADDCPSLSVLSERFGVGPSTLSKIRLGKRWAYPPEEW